MSIVKSSESARNTQLGNAEISSTNMSVAEKISRCGKVFLHKGQHIRWLEFECALRREMVA